MKSFERKNEQQRGRQLITLLFWIYVIVLLRITVFRDDFSLSHIMTNGKLNLELFSAYISFLRGGFIWLFIYLFVGNIVWFIPLGVYLVWKKPGHTIWRAVLIGFLMSLAIEVSQYVFGVGVSEVDDLVLNTSGTLIGAGLMRIIQLVMKGRWSIDES